MPEGNMSGKDYNFVFACSGAADVGAIADQAARLIRCEGAAAMCCTVAISAGIPDILDKARGAKKTVVFDGCSLNCAKTILEKADLDGFTHIMLEDLGMPKGKTPPTDERVRSVADTGLRALGA